ncbi:MAG: antitoxin [Oscillospiraceae bacterium]|jgi:hypothetical protein|nr:antitoxin [Oscillospiraceae bacterium]
MKAEYDFSKGVKNPYYKELHREITIPVDAYIYERFEKIAREKGVSINRVINRCFDEFSQKLISEEL